MAATLSAMAAEPPREPDDPVAPRRPGALRRFANLFVRYWANWVLAAFLAVECVAGALYAADAWWDKVLWIAVGGLLIVNSLRRVPPAEADNRWWVWIVCTASTLRFLAFEYTDESRTAFWLLVLFNLLADTALLALGRSFSLLPARREIRTGWMYRYVRHPAYAAYMFVDVVYFSQLPTPRNAAVVLIGLALFVCRAKLEERLLREDPAYREYMQRVRWRFLPGVY